MKGLKEELNYFLFLGIFILSFVILGPLPQISAQFSNNVNGTISPYSIINGVVGVGVTAGTQYMTPVANAVITFVSNDGKTKATGYSDINGHFLLNKPLPWGGYIVNASHPNFALTYWQGSQLLTLPAGIWVDYQLHLPMEFNAGPIGASCPSTTVNTACGGVAVPDTLSGITFRSGCPTGCSGVVQAFCSSGTYRTDDTCESVIEPGVQQISKDLADDFNPVLSTNKVLWERFYGTNSNKPSDLVSYDFWTHQEKTIFTFSYFVGGLGNNTYDISGNYAVWSDNKQGSLRSIYLYDFNATENQIVNISNDPTIDFWRPAIDGNQVVWIERGNYPNPNKIVLYDILSKTKQTIGSTNSLSRADISGGKIIWTAVAVDNFGRNLLYVYNPDVHSLGQSSLIDSNVDGLNFSIHKNKVVYEKYDSLTKDWSVYVYDLSTNGPAQLVATTGNFYGNIDIFGNKVVYSKTVNSNTDIYMTDILTHATQQITAHSSGQSNPKIWGNKVVWQDSRNLNSDIYSYQLPPECGNGILEAGERCDDGNTNETDGCLSSCRIDTDRDMIANKFDNCPFVANNNQLDTDKDGVGDACDNCASVANPDQTDSNGNGIGDACGCFIATAAYGTPMHKDIDVLRKYRDEVLEKNKFGQKFVEFYYKNSPPIANVISQHEWARKIVRGALKPVINAARWWLERNQK